MKKTNAKSWLYKVMDAMPVGIQFTSIDLMKNCHSETGQTHMPSTFTRHLRSYRQETGRRIDCVKKDKSLYEVTG